MEIKILNPDLYELYIGNVKGLSILKVNAHGAIMEQDIKLRSNREDLYEQYLELQQIFGGLIM